ncbi:UNVERIFIED_CONTAM: hypothetical protein Sradi_5418100 [Sesamum radiatum]|uniref:Uncharacterized protein n=1 Tax=Sesamum radiatum TaxID=300843 RepID=A0AAW2LA13_SESRA
MKGDIIFSKRMQDRARGGETPHSHSPRGTPASSKSKGKRHVSPVAGFTPGGSSK